MKFAANLFVLLLLPAALGALAVLLLADWLGTLFQRK